MFQAIADIARKLIADNVTKDDIIALRGDAIATGNAELSYSCRLALAGDKHHMGAVLDIINGEAYDKLYARTGMVEDSHVIDDNSKCEMCKTKWTMVQVNFHSLDYIKVCIECSNILYSL